MPGPFDVSDPFGVNARFRAPFGDPFGGAGRQPAAIQPLPPAEQESALSRLGQTALGGLGWLGETLDKTFGGRTVRGLLGGKGIGESLAHLVPLSDTMGLTNPEDAVSGKELLGYDKHDDSWGGLLGGMAAEMLLDPASYLTLGGSALSKTGQAAKRAGVLPKSYAARFAGLAAGSPEAEAAARTLFKVPAGPLAASQLADVSNKPLGYLARAAVPFAPSLGEVGLSGQRAAEVADKIGDFAKYNPVSRTLAPMFDASLSRLGPAPFSEEAQRATRGAVEDLGKGQAEAMKTHFARVKQLEDAGFLDEAKALRQQIENQYAGPTSPGAQAGAAVAASTRTEKAAQLAENQALGIPTGENVSQFGVEYGHRQMTKDTEEALKKAGVDTSLLQPKSSDMKKRAAELDIPGGTEKINDLLADPQAVARGSKQQIDAARDYVRKAIGFDDAEHLRLNSMNGGKGPAPTIPGPTGTVPNPDFARWQELNTLHERGGAVADLAGKLPDEFRTNGLRFFGNHPLADVTSYNLAHVKQTQAAKAWYDTAAAGVLTKPVGEAPTLWDVLRDKNVMYKTTRDGTGAIQGKIPQLLDRLEQSGTLPQGFAAQAKPKDIKDALSNLWVKPQVAADLLRKDQTLKVPYSLKPALGVFDKVTNLTKMGQTAPWPAFHARNDMSGVWQNLVGQAGYGPAGLNVISPRLDAMALRQGKILDWANTIPGFEHLTPADATRALLESAYTHGARIPAERSLTNELLGKQAQDTGMAGLIGTLGNRQEKSIWQSLKEGVGLAADPTNPRTGQGWLGRFNPLDVENFAPAKAGREISQATDDMNRLAGFLGYVKQGYSPQAAAEGVKGLHWSGGIGAMGQGGMAPFEREVMRRLAPFYSWSRQNVPFQFGQLAQKPGGLTARALQATGEMRQQEGMLPDWIGEGMAIPVGAREGNTQRYLSSLGLPFEDLARFVNTGASPVKRTMQETLGQLNPLLKGPLEYATGQQFYSGRPMQELYARSGNPVLDQIAMNSPISRATSLLGQLADPRKGLSGFATNFVSPFRLTDVDMERAGAIRERQILDDALRQNPAVRQFLEFYVPREQVPGLDPQTLEQLRLYRTLVDQAKAHAQQRPVTFPMN